MFKTYYDRFKKTYHNYTFYHNCQFIVCHNMSKPLICRLFQYARILFTRVLLHSLVSHCLPTFLDARRRCLPTPSTKDVFISHSHGLPQQLTKSTFSIVTPLSQTQPQFSIPHPIITSETRRSTQHNSKHSPNQKP